MMPILRSGSFLRYLLIILFITGTVVPGGAQQANDLPVVRLKRQTIYALPNAQRWIDSMSARRSIIAPGEALFVFSALTSAAQQAQLREAGYELAAYLTDKAYIARIGEQVRPANAQSLGLYAVYPFPASWKISILPEGASGAATVDLLVAVYPDISRAAVEAAVKQYGGRLNASALAEQHYYEISLPFDKIMTLAQWYGIRTISPAARDQPLNYESQGATKTNLAHAPVALGGYGLLGDSITIGVGDNNSGVNHVDLRDRIINYNPLPYTNHGQHINGIVGAAGTADPNGEGFAPHATLVDHLYNLVWARTGTMVRDHNMTVTNNSYAAVVGNCAFEGVYDAYSQALDSICLQYPGVLHVFAAGNDGSLSCPPYLPGFGNVTGSYQPAKNVLVVAQSHKRYGWGTNSSRGPVRDGRLKPEITAIGTDVYSTTRGDAYIYSGGTSMASPQVAGAAGLLQQRYKQLHSGARPTSDIIKTLLMNGAMDVGNPGPDFTFGFGIMDLYRSLQMLDNNRYRRGVVNNGGQQTINIAVPANTAQLKVMLYWHEGPASVLAATQLINDLDLEVADPSGTVKLPFILNPSPANVNDNATTGADHLNNVEQVVIDNPVAGNYTVRIKGTAIPGAAPDYVVAYDFIPAGVRLTYPSTGAMAKTDDTMRVYWDASPDAHTLTLEFSDNNGSSWTVLDNNLAADRRQYAWYPTGVSSARCLMRLTRNTTGEQFTTGLFSMNPRPNLSLSANQCPGYINIHWSPVPNADAYRVWRKKGPYLQQEATVTDTGYVFSGLGYDSLYYAAVQPLFNGTPGYRSLAVSRKPDNGNCAGSMSDGDMAVDGIVIPATGRAGTSTGLGMVNYIEAIVHNLDDAAAGNYSLAWQVNGGPWQSQVITAGIPAGGQLQYPLPFFRNLSSPGTYVIRVAVKNLSAADNVPQNDTVLKVVRQLANAPLNLATAFNDGFEDSPAFTAFKDSLGFTPNEHWDYYNSSDTGRLRTFVNGDITISGNRSVSMDVFQYRAPVTNFLTGTFNLGNYNAASGDEVRLEFDYKLHGNSHFPDSNKVWARGSDTSPWVPFFRYDTVAVQGQVYHSGSISLNDLMTASGQNFSTSTQIRFGQRDSTVIAMNDYGTGLTLDNIKLYLVQNDLALQAILSPAAVSCNTSSAPVTVLVHNGVDIPVSNATVSYQLDNRPVVTESLPVLNGKADLTYTFAAGLTNIATGGHQLKVWVNAPGDTYRQNDTLLRSLRNQPLIAAFPYLEQFETGDGYWYAGGRNTTWAYGAPLTVHVPNAASGSKAWKTNLGGYYSDNELSYLYSPCFDLTGLTAPMLSFSAVLDIENCGTTLCDAAWVEYTRDNGVTWTKLGRVNEGYAWYTDTAAQVWNTQGDYRWHVASIPLPVTSGTLQLRFVLATDPGTGAEGIALDDIHIFNRDYGIYDGQSTGPLSRALSGNGFVSYTRDNKIVAAIDPQGQALGATEVQAYIHPAPDTASMQYYLQRSFTVQSAATPADSVTVRLFVLDAEADSLAKATGCGSCSRPADVYRLGCSKYDDTVQANENGTLYDNITGSWTFYPRSVVRWVPYDNGYYAELRVPSFSEFWFNDGGPQGNLSLPTYTLGSNVLVSVYPNPNTDGIVQLRWNAGLVKSISVSLTNMAGQEIYTATLASQNGGNAASLNIGAVAKGMYFLHCAIGDKRYTEKIVFK